MVGFLLITVAAGVALSRLLSRVPPPPPAFTWNGIITTVVAIAGGWLIFKERRHRNRANGKRDMA
jgi:hypothetical protein